MSEIACGSGARVFRRRLRLAGYFRTLPFWRCTLRGCPRTFRRPGPSFGRVLLHGNLLAVPAIDVNAADDDGLTPLMAAAGVGQWRSSLRCAPMVKKLLQAPGMNLHATDNQGRNALEYARRGCSGDIIQMVRSALAISEGVGPLAWAGP